MDFANQNYKKNDAVRFFCCHYTDCIDLGTIFWPSYPWLKQVDHHCTVHLSTKRAIENNDDIIQRIFPGKKCKETKQIIYTFIPSNRRSQPLITQTTRFWDGGNTLATVIVLLLCSNFPLHYLTCGVGMCIPVGILLIMAQPYRIKRILIFLNPWTDPRGAGFQIIQSLIAIGSGGLWGLGIGHSKQKFFYLPMQHTDFIFAIIAEETGLIGCLVVISLFIAFLYAGIRLALKMSSLFACYTIIGFTTIITLQSIINMAVSTGLVPTK